MQGIEEFRSICAAGEKDFADFSLRGIVLKETHSILLKLPS